MRNPPGNAGPGELDAWLADWLDESATWQGFDPLGRFAGRAAVADGFWRPLLRAFPDLARRDDIFLTGRYQGADWVSATGYYVGNFVDEWLGLPPTGKLTYLRFGEFHRVEGDRVVETAMLIDVLDLMRQAGCSPLPPGPGCEQLVPGPGTHDGIVDAAADPEESRRSLETVESMLLGLATPDKKWAPFWHDDMLWHGPCGIGSFRGIPAFDAFQVPFEQAFTGWGGGIHGHTQTRHTTRFAQGLYVTSGGFPSVTGVHDGAWLGFEPTGQRVYMRVMDWWRRDGEKLAENWVMIDMIDVLRQFGVDALAAARARCASTQDTE